MSKITVSITILIISFLLIMLVLYLFYRREINIKKKSTFKTVGRVVGYNSKNEVPISLPIVEYTVNGKIYRKKYRYSYFVETSNKSKQTDVLDVKYVYGFGENLDLKKIFPIGSTMTVYYNPNKPNVGFVERFAGLDKVLKIIMLIISVAYLLLIFLLLFVL